MNITINPTLTATLAADRRRAFSHEADVRRLRRLARRSRRAKAAPALPSIPGSDGITVVIPAVMPVPTLARA